MAKDTKEIVKKAFLTLVSKQNPITLTELSNLSGVMRPTITKNFGKNPIQGIVDYIYNQIFDKISQELLLHGDDEIPPEIFINICIHELYKHREELKILLSNHVNLQYNFIQIDNITRIYWKWVKARFERLVKVNGLTPQITAYDLFEYWNRWLNSVMILWISSSVPEDPELTKLMFMKLLGTSMRTLIYPEF